jgi:hypothetical protein
MSPDVSYAVILTRAASYHFSVDRDGFGITAPGVDRPGAIAKGE